MKMLLKVHTPQQLYYSEFEVACSSTHTNI